MLFKKSKKDTMELIKGGVALGYAGTLPGAGSVAAPMLTGYGKAAGIVGAGMQLEAIDHLTKKARRKR